MTGDPLEILTTKLVVIEALVRTMVVENLAEIDDPIQRMRDYAGRLDKALVDAIPTGPQSHPAMLVQAEIAEQFGVIEKWLKQIM